MGNIDIIKSKQRPPIGQNIFGGLVNDGVLEVNHLNTTQYIRPMHPIMQQPIMYEPKRNNRFILRFGNEDSIESWMVRSVTRPSGNYTNGQFSWADLEITLLDSIGPSTSQNLMETLRTNHEQMEFNLEMLDPTGVVVESWQILGFISQFDFGMLSYSDPGLTQITIKITVNECTLRY